MAPSVDPAGSWFGADAARQPYPTNGPVPPAGARLTRAPDGAVVAARRTVTWAHTRGRSSAEERPPYKREVAGSTPAVPTSCSQQRTRRPGGTQASTAMKSLEREWPSVASAPVRSDRAQASPRCGSLYHLCWLPVLIVPIHHLPCGQPVGGATPSRRDAGAGFGDGVPRCALPCLKGRTTAHEREPQRRLAARRSPRR